MDLLELNDLFEVRNGLASSNVSVFERGGQDLVAYLRPSNLLANTVAGFIERQSVDAKYVYPKETLFVSTDGEGSHSFSYVSPIEFVPNSNVAVLIPRMPISLQQKLFYAFCITKNRYLFSYGRKPKGDRLKRIKLPNASDVPSWAKDFDVSAYANAEVSVNKLPTPVLDTANWQEFRYKQLFDIKKGKRLTKANMLPGTVPFIGSSDSNNGLTSMIGQDAIHGGNVISLAYNGSVGEAFYQPEPFWAADDVNVLYPVGFKLNSAIGLFLCTLIRKEQYRFNYGRKWHTDRMNESVIRLPVDGSGNPDWQFMELYINSLPYSSQI